MSTHCKTIFAVVTPPAAAGGGGVLNQAPTAPRSLIILTTGTTTAVATWTAPFRFDGDTKGYRLTLSGGDYNPIPELADNIITYAITGLDPDTEYTGSLIAFNEFGDSYPATHVFQTAPTVTVALKAQPRGIFVAIPVLGDGTWGNAAAFPFWGYAYIDGVRARTGWNSVESLEGGYDWTFIDDMLDVADAHSKKIGLSIGMGLNAPEWVYANGATKFNVIAPDAGHMPILWRNSFLSQAKTFIDAVGERYDGNSALSYLVMGGMAQIIEFALTSDPGAYATILGLANDDGYPTLGDAWLAGAKAVTGYWKEAFPTTRIIASTGGIYPIEFGGIPFAQAYAAWGVATYGSRFGLMSAGLNGGSYHPPDLHWRDQLVFDNSATNPVGFQVVAGSVNPRSDPTQDPTPGIYDPLLAFQHIMDAGVSLKAKYIEPYKADAVNLDAGYTSKMISTRTAMALLP